MRHSRQVMIALAFFGLMSVTPGAAQDAAPASPRPSETTTDAATIAAAEHAKQLRTCREGILDEAARDVDRRRWVELLFGYGSDQATALIVELLAPTQPVAVSKTICEVMLDTARDNPSRLVSAFVEPLLVLLGAEDAELRDMVASTIAEFPRDGLAARLGDIAGDDGAPMPKRLAAIDALSNNTQHREVVRQLIARLDSSSSEILAKVTATLEQASPEGYGYDVAQWKRWWQDNEQLSDEQWLEGRLRLYRQHSRRVTAAFDAYKAEAQVGFESSIAQIRSLQSELYRVLPPEQRRTKLIGWLASPLSVVKLTALDLIKSRIADEGKPPSGEVLSALVKLLNDGDAVQRREALLIIQNVHDPVVVEAVLSRLESELVPSLRLAVLSALGHMRSAEGIPALVRELKQDTADTMFVREAALSLGMIAERVEDKTAFQPAIEPLRKRFTETPTEDVALRAALLSAMAGVADRSFAPAFAETVESDDLRLLQPAILGLRTLGDRSKLERIRDLTANGDPLVRLAAIEAVAELGRDAEDLQSLLTRLNPSIEPNTLAREAAWRGFSSYMARRPVSERIDTAKRLRDTPELAARYLNELADTLVATGGEPLDLESVRDDLARILVAQGKHAAAAAQLRLLFQQQVDRQAESAGTVGVRWLDASLRAVPPVDVTEVISRIVTRVSSDAVRAGVIDAVTQYVDDPVITSDAERARAVLDELKAVPADGWPPQWAALLQKLSARVQKSQP